MKWSKSLKGKVRFNEPLKDNTSFRIGGNSRIWFEPKNITDLVNCLSIVRKIKVPHFIIGNGTNLLVKDDGFRGVVIKLNSPSFKKINQKGNILTIGAGLSLRELIKFLSGKDFSGYEFLAGIPGTVGGALVMNAGVTRNGRRYSIGDIAHKVKVLNNKGEILNLEKDELFFRYRNSNLNEFIILEAQFKLKSREYINTKNRINDFLSARRIKQDNSKPNAGCIFKNPSENLAAGKLIDRCGLKGKRYGGAMVSNKHANFILNFDGATAKDVIKLIQIIKKKVRERFGIRLEEEIKIV